MAYDLDLHLCLPELVRGMRSPKTDEEIEADRPLVNGARVWLAVLKTHLE